MRTYRPAGFSLVELLVSTGIIAILVALSLVAVNAVREAARRTQCQSNLEQLGIAIAAHESAQRHFPSGGWGFRWAGDPDRGFGVEQPGGWTYNILPFISEGSLRNRGKALEAPDKRQMGKEIAERAISLFTCPTRRSPLAFPYVNPQVYYNIDQPVKVGHSDFAANSGDRYCCSTSHFRAGPLSLEEGDAAEVEPPLSPDGGQSIPSGVSFMWSRITLDGTGLIYQRSMVRTSQVTDGLSHTYLLGEKFVPPSQYKNGKNTGDDQSWDVGFDRDIQRWTQVGFDLLPRQDQDIDPKLDINNSWRFGSAHPNAMNFLFADGSVRKVSYTIDPEVHACLGNRADGKSINSP